MEGLEGVGDTDKETPHKNVPLNKGAVICPDILVL